jgi:hypothetical protein
LNHGIYDDPKIPENHLNGVPVKSDGVVKDLLFYNQTEVRKIMDDCYEKKYQTN